MDGARAAMESGVEDGFRRARIEALVVLALVCGRKCTGVIDRAFVGFAETQSGEAKEAVLLGRRKESRVSGDVLSLRDGERVEPRIQGLRG
jgi:hypothetical protein